MKIGIIGAGEIGSAIARILTRAGIPAAIANSRGPASLAALTDELGPTLTAVSAAEAAQADLVFLAVPWSRIPAAVAGLGPWTKRIVVDTSNPIEAPLFQPADLNGKASSSVVQDLVPGAHVVKAFNHLQPGLLAASPAAQGGKRVLFVSGDHAASKHAVMALIQQLGFAGIDLGTLDGGGRLAQFPGGPLPSLNLVKFG
ncbi:NADP oxidoreductase [Massilia sp. Root351]|jgi:predicted dinucleotide-binding enzyme|uniref:NADPH-dependent F420 reductase n=1 Tax=Massilia sp. Root351 TaxID=1736522 RepID=UPI000709088C|nr:NAD(P)-binding domain-containing protein [Massilia sp. Root351]KQV79134.1 NADP oxidoreductase [Massilia sp. Root351]